MRYEVDVYKTSKILIFRKPTPEDFVISNSYARKTKEDAMGIVKGENGSAECVDAPYPPIKVYQVRIKVYQVRKTKKGKSRKLIWSQGWDDCWGGKEIHPK